MARSHLQRRSTADAAGPCRIRHRAFVLCLLGATALLGACVDSPDMLQTSGIDRGDYRQRHPIHIGEGVEATFIPVARGSSVMPAATEAEVRDFARGVVRDGTSPLTVSVPVGSANAKAAQLAATRIRALAAAAGLPRARVLLETYAVADGAATPPIRLAYWRIKATVTGCGQWKDDFGDPNFANNPTDEFGCATQANFAAMLADPNDLVRPRAAMPADAARRVTVISAYEKGQKTSAQAATPTASTTRSN